MKKYYYFAYGSNMACSQIGERCPDAEVVGPARLPGYRLAFTRYSEGWRCGVADAVPCKGADVWGVLYLISDKDLIRLDDREGYYGEGQGNAYVRRVGEVWLGGPDGEKRVPDVYIYFVANPVFGERGEGAFKPGALYKTMMVRAAEHHGLPAAYVAMLKELPTY